MTVTELLLKIQQLNDEIGCNGKTIASHDIKSSISFYIEDHKDEYELVDMEPKILPGCMCWHGIDIILRKKLG